MAKVRIAVGCLVDGKQLRPGDLVEVPDDVAAELVAMGRGVIDDSPEPRQATQPAAKQAVQKTSSSKRTTASKGRRKKITNS